jgi:hypothetical protein
MSDNNARILRVFINCDMRNSFNGLRKLAAKHEVKVNALKEGDFVIFINTARTKLKALGSGDVLCYVAKDHKISLDAIQYIPAAFKAKRKFDYPEALRIAVEKALKGKERKALLYF